jgi:hypothetical protein
VTMRVMFAVTVVVIVAGLAYVFAIGLLHR